MGKETEVKVWDWVILILVGAGLIGSGYVTGCSQALKQNQVTNVDTKMTSDQTTTTKVVSMNGQVMILLFGSDTNQYKQFNINLKDITNMSVNISNFSEHFTVSNGKTNR